MSLLDRLSSCATQCEHDRSLWIQGLAASVAWDIAGKQAALCAETPDAQVGDPCDVGSDPPILMTPIPCLPTRARLNGDGTVAGQDYLACDATTHTCTAASAPVIDGFLQPCDAWVMSMFGAGVNGVYAELWTTQSVGPPSIPPDGCLLAWDDATQTLTSGKTIKCIGDWQCPVGTLCDDQLMFVLPYASDHPGFCKPGPRGTLTPAMLSR